MQFLERVTDRVTMRTTVPRGHGTFRYEVLVDDVSVWTRKLDGQYSRQEARTALAR